MILASRLSIPSIFSATLIAAALACALPRAARADVAQPAKAAAPAPAPKTAAPATSADAGAPASSSSKAAPTAARPLDEAAALSKVSALPEVAEVQAELNKARVPMAIRRDDDGSGGPMQFAIAEDHDDHQVTRYRFGVEPATGALTAYQVECDLWAPLAKWRALRKKLLAMTAAQRDDFDTCAELVR